ncbi:hypothetical protein G7Z17_g6805 [Cylindrodendrum hubeiense]|uniref:Choline monooxygenase, chloroplastic n=1 Tax=Cylindrodendrum hubeiense TaxID=595255 RepID=A0A9P5LAG7_9HYPO|nr:hypothetical protein G7Z17_g6805 [Cylindrodendrum hubeiense]
MADCSTTLPASWYTSKAVYDLERRAVFLKTLTFEEYFPGLEELIAHVDFTQFPVRRTLDYSGKYNWKAMVDGFQECLHCPYAHPAFYKPNDGLFLYFFPNCTLNLYGGGMSSFRACPSEDPSETNMLFDYYHCEPDGSQEFENYFKFARTVGVEDHEICEKTQQNLEAGIYTEGILNPEKENGVAYYQGRVLEMCSAQFQKESIGA